MASSIASTNPLKVVASAARKAPFAQTQRPRHFVGRQAVHGHYVAFFQRWGQRLIDACGEKGPAERAL